ncbi:MAG: hypothetical protein J6N70_16840 [Oribacterium sp.]|nr:hypothetical protein [Oribacterium sp.]
MKYEFKILYSPIKWIGCLILVMLIPLAMYVPTYFDFVNVSSIYMPFVGIVLFSDINLLYKESHTEEIMYLINKKPIKFFLKRYLITVALLIIFIVVENIIFRIVQQFQGEVLDEPISMISAIAIVTGSCLFVSAISMTISTIFGSIYIGYGFSGIFWIYWNINCQKESIINPFPFIANPTFYEKHLVFIYIITIGLILINCFLCTRSPFYVGDKIRKYIYH